MADDILERSASEDIRKSLTAMTLAARRAREIGKATGTGIVIQRDGRMMEDSAEEIELEAEDSGSFAITH